jgi:hypothetical protein
MSPDVLMGLGIDRHDFTVWQSNSPIQYLDGVDKELDLALLGI